MKKAWENRNSKFHRNSECGTRRSFRTLITIFILTLPIRFVVLFQKLDLHVERNELFSLQGVPLDATICETLEEILKRVQFCQINLESTALDDEVSEQIKVFLTRCGRWKGS